MERVTARMEVFFADARERLVMPCEVLMRDGQLVVDYEDGGRVVYTGTDGHGHGHFTLKGSSNVDGRATLHMAEDGRCFEGYWVEDNQVGMWRILFD